MKMLKAIVIVAAACALLISSAAAKTIHVFVSSQMPPQARNSVYQTVARHAIESQPPGDTMKIYCGNSAELIATFELPDYEFYRTNKAKRVAKMAPGIAALKDWIGRKPQIREDYLSLDVPRIFAFVRENVERDLSGDVLLLAGSPIVTSAGEKAFSMADSYLPSDSHLKATRQQSVYGLAGAEKTLDGLIVRWAFLSEPFGDRTAFAGANRRWWSLFCRHQGATLATFDVSLASVFGTLEQARAVPVCMAEASYGEDLQMVQYQEIVRKPAGPEASQKPEMPVATKGIEFLETTELADKPLQKLTLQSMKCGISWKEEGADLDLYVRPHPEAQELSFRNQSSPEGRHVRDHVRSPEAGAYEVVELGPCDLTKVTIAVNLYRSVRTDVTIPATVRVEANGQVYSKDIEIQPGKGNGGSDRDKDRAGSKHWVIVDLLELVGLK